MEGTVAEETLVERLLVEKSANSKTVAEGEANKKWKAD